MVDICLKTCRHTKGRTTGRTGGRQGRCRLSLDNISTVCRKRSFIKQITLYTMSLREKKAGQVLFFSRQTNLYI